MPPEITPGLSRVHVEAATDGLVLTLDLTHWYENTSAEPIEVVYTFPIPFDAVVLGVEAEIDGRAMAVKLCEASQAEDVFEGVQAERGAAALVERRTPGLCTASLGRLVPGAVVGLRLRLGRFLEVAGGRGRIVVPSVASLPEGSQRAVAAGPFGAPIASLLADYSLTLRLTLSQSAAVATVASPTHGLSREDCRDEVVLTLAMPAALDRDVVVTLDGLPEQNGGWIVHPAGRLAIAASTLPMTQTRQPMNAVVLIDAAGPLGPLMGDASHLLEMLACEQEPVDRLSFARVGRTLSPILLARAGAEGSPIAESGGRAADLGDIAPGAPPPPIDLPTDADVCLVTDGRTRVSEAVAQWTAAEKRRLFVVGAGSAPDAGWLHPAALATGGDYMGLSPEEALEPAAHRLLSALTLPAVRRPRAHWSQAPVWTEEPRVWRSGLRGIASAAFEDDSRTDIAVAFENDGAAIRLDQRDAHDPLAQTALRLAAALRLTTLRGDEAADWASRFTLPLAGTAWIAEADWLQQVGSDEARLVVTPQMVSAGWRGVGTVTPSPAPRSAASPPPPFQTGPRPVGARKPRPLGMAVAALVAVAAAGVGVWEGLRPPPAPEVASSERFPSVSPRPHLPLSVASAERKAGQGESDGPGRLVETPIAGPATAWIVALVAGAVGLALWLRGRRPRRG